jgi:hypothetical protein
MEAKTPANGDGYPPRLDVSRRLAKSKERS